MDTWKETVQGQKKTNHPALTLFASLWPAEKEGNAFAIAKFPLK